MKHKRNNTQRVKKISKRVKKRGSAEERKKANNHPESKKRKASRAGSAKHLRRKVRGKKTQREKGLQCRNLLEEW